VRKGAVSVEELADVRAKIRITNQLMKNDKPPCPSHSWFIAHSMAVTVPFSM
jgi:hypothetical protein